MVSIPSGMMTMSEVPTKTPVPSSVMMRSWRGERVKESGKMPAMKELLLSAAMLPLSLWCAGFAYAIAISVLKVSSMKRPSHMLGICSVTLKRKKGCGKERGRNQFVTLC
jgi:hypothetical protein